MSELPPIRQSDEEVDLRTLVRIGVFSVLVALLSVGLVYVVLARRGDVGVGGLGRSPSARSLPIVERLIEAPAHPSRPEAPASLDAYRWVDRDAGIATIPIERAMEIVEERGR